MLYYNRARTENPLFPGDRFIRINGLRLEHPDQLRDAVQRASVLRVSVQRQRARFFANKSMRSAGDTLLHEVNPSLGFRCSKGRKASIPNQDSWFAIELQGSYALYGVFDGHGPDGHHISQFAKEKLPKVILRDPRFLSFDMSEMFKESFLAVQARIALADKQGRLRAKESGTTATLVVHDIPSKRIVVAHVGDSTAAIARRSRGRSLPFSFGLDWFGGSGWELLPLTQDHKPDSVRELARIHQAGFDIMFDGRNHRIRCADGLPGLNLSRSLGDLDGNSCGVLAAEPDVREHLLTAEDEFVLLCSDGVWEYLPPNEASASLGRQVLTAPAVAETLAVEAQERWCRAAGDTLGYVDDITTVVASLKPISRVNH